MKFVLNYIHIIEVEYYILDSLQQKELTTVKILDL
jgi:hypothetical protein